jgi:hypothetical protein
MKMRPLHPTAAEELVTMRALTARHVRERSEGVSDAYPPPVVHVG